MIQTLTFLTPWGRIILVIFCRRGLRHEKISLCALHSPITPSFSMLLFAGHPSNGPDPGLRTPNKASALERKHRQRIEDFAAVTEDAQPLDKDFSLFAYYPDMTLTITRDGQAGPTAVVDINGEYVDFYYSGETQLYRSKMSSVDLKKLIHQPTK